MSLTVLSNHKPTGIVRQKVREREFIIQVSKSNNCTISTTRETFKPMVKCNTATDTVIETKVGLQQLFLTSIKTNRAYYRTLVEKDSAGVGFTKNNI